MSRSIEEWKRVTSMILNVGTYDDILSSFSSLSSNHSKRMNKIAQYYFFKPRIKTVVESAKPFYSIIINKEDYDIAVERTLKFFSKDIDENHFEESLAKALQSYGRLFGKYHIPSQFPFTRAREIIKKYNVNGKLFDYSCGWGNRLMASLVEGVDYYGVDTNDELVEKLKECSRDFQAATNSKVITDIRCQGSETLINEYVGKIGLCFSSPPYFNLEKYQGEHSSSNISDYDTWLKDYLEPTIRNCYEYLVDGGYFICNLKNMGKRKMYDDAKMIAEKIGFQFVCDEPLRVKQRKGAQNQKDAKKSQADELMMVMEK